MSKNIVVIPMVIPKDKNLDKFGGWEWMSYSKQAWQFWCDTNGYELVIYDEPSIEDTSKYRITIQRWFDIFDFLDRKNIKYDQIAMADACSMPRWDCPDFFKLTDNKFTAGLDHDNLRWIYESVQGYKDVFNGYELDINKYFCSGFTVFNESHRELFKEFKEFYMENDDTFVELQTKTVKRGTCQTPLNYLVQKNNIDITYFPKPYRLSHLHRKEMLNHNWQLNEDMTPFFIKYGYVWMFSGFDKTQRDSLMDQVWNHVKGHYYIDDEMDIIERIDSDRIDNKDVNKNSTTAKFKKDICDIFNKSKYKDMTILELGCHQGNTTRVYSECFGKVIAVELSEENMEKTKNRCLGVDNVEFINSDIYNPDFKLPKADVVHIDAGHTYEAVCFDVDRCMKELDNPTFIFDDHGNPRQDIRRAIYDKMEEYGLTIDKFIGEGDGYICAHGLVFDEPEGVVLNLK